jgi:hypothetical protein
MLMETTNSQTIDNLTVGNPSTVTLNFPDNLVPPGDYVLVIAITQSYVSNVLGVYRSNSTAGNWVVTDYYALAINLAFTLNYKKAQMIFTSSSDAGFNNTLMRTTQSRSLQVRRSPTIS